MSRSGMRGRTHRLPRRLRVRLLTWSLPLFSPISLGILARELARVTLHARLQGSQGGKSRGKQRNKNISKGKTIADTRCWDE